MTTATFQYGETFKYGGKRDVTAAWCIRRRESGEIVRKGFSLDRARAEKSAASVFTDYHLTKPSYIEIVDID